MNSLVALELSELRILGGPLVGRRDIELAQLELARAHETRPRREGQQLLRVRRHGFRMRLGALAEASGSGG